MPSTTLAQVDLERGLARVHDIRFEGVESAATGSIKKVLKTKTKKRFAFWNKPPLLRQDFVRSDTRTIELYYQRLGFLDVAVRSLVTSEEETDRATVLFVVTEGKRSYLRDIQFSGIRVFETEELLRKIGLRVDKPFNPIQVGTDRDILLGLYADVGHFAIVRASWSRIDTSVIGVRFEINEGPVYKVGEIDIEGVQKVDTVVVRREVLLETGGVFQRKQLVESIERLYGTSLFQVVDFVPSRVDTITSTVDLNISVRERKHRRLEGGVGIGTADGFRILGSWSNRNLWGKAHILSLNSSIWFGARGRFSNDISYVDPWLFGTRVRGGVTGFLNQETIFFENGEFDERSWGFVLTTQREYTRQTTVSLSWENRWSEVVRQEGAIPPEFGNIQKLFTSRLVFIPTYDTRNNIFDARRGQFYRMVAEFAGEILGSSSDFQKVTISGAWHFQTSRRSSISTRLQLGRLWPFDDARLALIDVPATDLYRTGGANSVRGYVEQDISGAESVGGLLLLVSNLEYRFPLGRLLSGSVFLDGGSVWAQPSDFEFSQIIPPSSGELLQPNDYRWSIGSGVRVASPVGPIRLDVAYRLWREEIDGQADTNSRAALHLSFGQPF